jgi:hypothetical protein
VAVVET